MITVIALSPSIDVSYVVEELAIGGMHRPSEVRRLAGGKSLNAARAAAIMGAAPSAIAVLGGDSGRFVAGELRTSGVSLHSVAGAAPTRTCISIASQVDGGMTELYEHASEVTEAEWRTVLAVAGQLLADRPGWLAVSGSVPGSLDPSVLAELVALGAASGVRVAIDGHGPSLEAAVAERPALVKVNRAEAAALLRRDGSGPLVDLARAVWQLSGGMVVITDGTNGSIGFDGAGCWRVRPAAAIGGFPVGSGDSFLGGMLVALDGGSSLVDALRLGAGCANANALVPGAACFDAETARELAAAVQLEEC